MNKTLCLLSVAVAVLLPPSVGMSQQTVRWEPTLESAQRVAAQTNRLVLIYFCGPSCVYCRRMEAEVLNQASVAAAINAEYVAVKVTADHFPATARRYGITHLPTTVLASPQGQVLDSKEGFVPTDDYIARLAQVAFEMKHRQAAVYAQIPPGATPPPVNQPPMNQPPMNQPVVNQPPVNQPPMYQPPVNQQVVNQPVPTQPANVQMPPPGQPSFGPAVTATAPPVAAAPSGALPPYGDQYRPIPSPPTAVQPPLPTVMQQPSQPPVAQQPIGPPQNGMAPQAPAGGPAFALDGYCPVSLVEKQQWIPGDSRWGMYHRGRLYRFAGPEEQRRFFADPDRYAPAVSGNDIVLAAEQGQVVPGRREYGVYYRSHVYLFSNEASRAKFEQNPSAFANQALEALRAGAYHPGTQLR